MANQEDVPMKQKMREIEKLYAQVGSRRGEEHRGPGGEREGLSGTSHVMAGHPEPWTPVAQLPSMWNLHGLRVQAEHAAPLVAGRVHR